MRKIHFLDRDLFPTRQRLGDIDMSGSAGVDRLERGEMVVGKVNSPLPNFLDLAVKQLGVLLGDNLP